LGHADVVKRLIAAGADVNAVAFSSESALYTAIKHDDEEIIRILVESGADLNCKSRRQIQ
jgi:ankyrin repeat protein